MSRIVRRKIAGSPSVQLRELETRAVVVRKMLTSFGRRRRAKLWGEKNDALQIVAEIELLAQFGQSCGAEDAVRIVGCIEVLTLKLSDVIDGVCTF